MAWPASIYKGGLIVLLAGFTFTGLGVTYYSLKFLAYGIAANPYIILPLLALGTWYSWPLVTFQLDLE